MADENQVKLIKEGVDVWNNWREANSAVQVDLRGADLSERILKGVKLRRADLRDVKLIEADLSGADLGYTNGNRVNFNRAKLSGAKLFGARLHRSNFYEADLHEANIYRADFYKADLRRANLSGAVLNRAWLVEADLSGANLSYADLREADLTKAKLCGSDIREAKLNNAYCNSTDLTKANLSGADLQSTILLETNLEQATLTGCKIYGLSAWGLKGTPNDQSNLIITPEKEAIITVDNIKVAQFIYLIVNNPDIRDVIDTITSKAVLILGRFTDQRKVMLDAIREELRNKYNFTPIVFDFDPASNQDITDTVTLLARMARFVIADLTDATGVQQELTLIAPEVLVAIRPIILKGQQPWSMFNDLRRRSRGLLPVYEYTDLDDLLQVLQNQIIAPAEAKRLELMPQA